MLLSILLIAQVAAVAPTPTPAPVTLTSTPLPQAGGGSISSVAGTVKIATTTPGKVTHGLTKLGAILVEPFKSKDKTNAGPGGEKKDA